MPRSVTFVVPGATNPPAAALLGLSVMFPVVFPPIIKGLAAVV